MSILINGIPLGGYEISIMKDGERYRARVDGIWCEVEEIPTTDTDSDTISRQAVLDALNNIEIPRNASWYQYYQQALTAVDKLPPAQPEQLGTNLASLGTDCISRQAAIDRATKEHDFFRGAVTVSDKARRDELLNVMCWLGELPSEQPKRGRWISADAMFHGVPFYCSECGENTRDTVMGKPRWNFCPNCGAKMEVTK